MVLKTRKGFRDPRPNAFTRHTVHTMNRQMNHQAQTLIEYAIVVTLVVAAVSAMSTYMFRSVQSTQKAVESVGLNQ